MQTFRPYKRHVIPNQQEVIQRLLQLLEKRPATREPLPSGRALAREWDVSFPVVHRALLVLQAHGHLMRRGNKYWAAEVSNLKKSFAIPVVLDVVGSSESLCQMIIRTAARIGAQIKTHAYDPFDQQSLVRVLRSVARAKPAGAIIECATSRLLDPLRGLDCPMAVIGCHDPDFIGIDYSLADDFLTALSHLRDLGHSTVSFLFDDDLLSNRESLSATFLATCHRMQMEGRVFPVASSNIDWRNRYSVFLERREKEIKKTTAILTLNVPVGEWVRKCAENRGWTIPGKFSLIALDLGNSESIPSGLTVVRRDPVQKGARLATLLLLDELLDSRPQRVFVPYQISLLGKMNPGVSTGALAKAESIPPLDFERRRPAAKVESRTSDLSDKYPGFGGDAERETFQIDLRPYANRGLTRYHGWLGTHPLRYFPPGLRVIHGIDFRVIDENYNEGQSAITMASQVAHTGAGEPLPESVSIPCAFKARALYFLHGCSYAEHGPFAGYHVTLDDNSVISIPLVALGRFGTLEREWKRQLAVSNVQDWWYELPQFSGRHFKNFEVAPMEDATVYTRYLYTLEWLNPNPLRDIRELRITSDPRSRTTLGVIAISAVA